MLYIARMIYDFIVVGHGIAGAILAYTLRKHGHRVLVIDEPKENSASNVAAGLLNPLAGKRFAKSWMADEFVPFADAFYDELEARYRQPLFFHKPIYKIFSSIEEQNNWMVKSADSTWNEYVLDTFTQSKEEAAVHDEHGGVLIGRGGYLLVSDMLRLLTQELQQEGLLLPERFRMEQLQLTEQGVLYKGIAAKHLVFSEGYQVVNNPYFRWLPLQPTKGEVLEVEIENFAPEYIYNKAVYVVPVGTTRFKVGATYNWRQPDEQVSVEGAAELTERLGQITSRAFSLKGHWAGIRPAVRDRRPLIGVHPKHRQLSVFNGMGSKGVMMAPYLAEYFTSSLAGETELLPGVNISRFLSLYYE